MNILFIEDEPSLLSVGLAQLEFHGHTVYPSVNVAGAREILSDTSITVGLIITDHQLPDGTGIDFIIEVKEKYPKIKSVVVSGHLTPKDVKKMEANDVLYFRKPLLYKKVVDEVRLHYAMKAPVRTVAEQKAEDARLKAAEEEALSEVKKPPLSKRIRDFFAELRVFKDH